MNDCLMTSQGTEVALSPLRWYHHRKPKGVPCLHACSSGLTLSSLGLGMGISWRRQMRVPWRHGKLACARDQLEAEHWGLSEADGGVRFGSWKLCKTRLAGLGGLVSRVA